MAEVIFSPGLRMLSKFRPEQRRRLDPPTQPVHAQREVAMMTLSEFKAWFEGFTESMDGPPSLKQWERIQARVKEISGASVTQPVFVDRYWPRPLWQGAVLATNHQNDVALYAAGQIGHNAALNGAGQMQAFDSHSAMADLGRADADALKAA